MPLPFAEHATAHATSVIELDGVAKRYRSPARPAALSGVNLRVAAGDVVAVVGPNGAGKSTLLGLILGFLHPSTGRIAIEGRAPRDWVRRNGAAWLPERFAPPPEWRVDRTLHAFARLEGCTDAQATTRAESAMRRFGLDADATREVAVLSRGLVQRLGLAQASLAERRLAVFDEPTEGLDPPGRIVFRESVAALRTAGCTVIIASHDLAELERIADRAIVLEAGRLRETIELRTSAEPSTWLLHLETPHDAVVELFPGALALQPDSDERGTGAASRTDGRGEGARFAVSADDARDLSARLAALIAAGAVVRAVTPASPSLEDRLRDGADAGRAGDRA